MKRVRLCRRQLLLLLIAIPVVPLTVWTIVLCLAPTDWARRKLVRELETVSGRKVSIESIRLGPLGNLRIKNVRFAEAMTTDDPWLTVSEARLDLHLLQMIMGCCKTTAIAVDGLDLRVHRRANGTFEFADLFAIDSKSKRHDGAETSSTSHSDLTFSITRSRVKVLDDASETQIELTEARANGSYKGSLATISSLKGRLNGGTLEFAAKYDPESSGPTFEAELRARGVSSSAGSKAIGLLVPVILESSESIEGRADLDLALHGNGHLLTTNRLELKGHGSIRLKPVDLSQSKIVDSLEALKQIPSTSRVGSVESDFAIDLGRVVTDDLTLSVSSFPIILAGWTDFDGRIDYRVKTEAIHERLASKLPPEARAILSEIKQELGDLADIRITGTVKNPQLLVGNRPFDGRGPARDEAKVRFREAAKKLSGKYLR